MEENSFMYMVNLNRFRIAVIGMIVIGLFAGFFFIGLAVGIKSQKMAGSPVDQSVLNVEDSAIDGSSTLVQTSPEGIDPIVAGMHESLADEGNAPLNRESMLAGNYDVPAEKILEKDNPEGTISTPKKKSTAALSASSKNQKYYIQLMVTADPVKADRIVQTLRSKSYKGYKRELAQGGRKLYHLRVGLYEDRSKASADLGILKAKGGFQEATLIENPLKKS